MQESEWLLLDFAAGLGREIDRAALVRGFQLPSAGSDHQ